LKTSEGEDANEIACWIVIQKWTPVDTETIIEIGVHLSADQEA